MARPLALRTSDAERKAWEQAAERAGLDLSKWLRRAANQTADLERAVEQQELKPVLKTPPSVQAVKDLIYPQMRKKCVHRMMPGTFCKKCGVTK